MEIVQNEMNDRTKDKDISEASADWAGSVLATYRVKHSAVQNGLFKQKRERHGMKAKTEALQGLFSGGRRIL